LQFRDLRATALTELSDAGADVIDLSTHSAHETTQMARRYVRRTATQFSRAAAKRLAAREVKSRSFLASAYDGHFQLMAANTKSATGKNGSPNIRGCSMKHSA